MTPNMAGILEERLLSKTARIAVLGQGYVGLPLSVQLAQAGFQVTGFDPDQAKVAQLAAGKSVVQDISDGVLNAVLNSQYRPTSHKEDIRDHDVYILCVPTPLNGAKQPDVSYIQAASQTVAEQMGNGALVILESTTYPGTTEELLLPALEVRGHAAEHDLFLAFSPERVDPGNPAFHTGNIPKIIGGLGERSTRLAELLYRSFLNEVHLVSSPRVAELAKLHENTFRAVNIGYVNELAMMCDALKIDVWEVIRAASSKPFGFMPFYPGPGIGGHCIPLDPHYLAWSARREGFVTRFIDLADHVNSYMPTHIVLRISDLLNQRKLTLNGARITVLGVAYKPDIDDVRESPALDVIRELELRQADVQYVDPYVSELPLHHGQALKAQRVDLNDATYQETDIFVILTNHAAFDWQDIMQRAALVFDTRGVSYGMKGSVARL